MSESAQAEPVPEDQEEACLGCSRTDIPRRSRGLCNTCYISALRTINKGVATWKDYEDAGLSLPPCQGKKFSSGVVVRLMKFREQMAKK